MRQAHAQRAGGAGAPMSRDEAKRALADRKTAILERRPFIERGGDEERAADEAVRHHHLGREQAGAQEEPLLAERSRARTRSKSAGIPRRSPRREEEPPRPGVAPPRRRAGSWARRSAASCRPSSRSTSPPRATRRQAPRTHRASRAPCPPCLPCRACRPCRPSPPCRSPCPRYRAKRERRSRRGSPARSPDRA